MSISIFGRGYPLSAEATDSTIKIAFAGIPLMDITSSYISASTFCVSALSGGVAGSAGQTYLEMSAAAAGNHLICAGPLVGTGAASGVSGNAVLVVRYNSRNYYIPAFSAVEYK